MTGEPITPWAEYHRAQWAAFADPLRPFGTDEEPSDYAEPWSYRVFDAAARWWHPALTAALAAVLLLLGLRAVRHPGGAR